MGHKINSVEVNSYVISSSKGISYQKNTVDVVDESINYSEFFEKYMRTNSPCIISGVSDDWQCSSKWIDNDTINIDYLCEEYGVLDAPVADCNNVTYNAHYKSTMKVADYLSYLKQKTDQLLYLKDWHLKRLQPQVPFYEVPPFFASDWLNEYAEDCEEDDFMFVYIGPKDSWTPLHADVYSSYSWSVNVVGRKKWILLPPGEEEKLKDKLGNLPILFNHETHRDINYFEIIQEKGDAIFVPSGWYHQVTNVLDTISINHNWINGCNVKKMWEALETNLMSVEKEIEEFRDSQDYTYQCQLILKSVFGMDLKIFISFICHIAKKRLKQLDIKQPMGFGKYIIGVNHIKFDLINIFDLMNLIQKHSHIANEKIIPKEMQSDFITVKDSISKLFT